MKIAVVGASGYAGGELLRLLAGHPKFEISYIAAGSNAGELITNLHPQLTSFAGRKFETTNVEMINKCELAFIALPHGESAKLVTQIDKSVKIVDLGADFRLQNPESWKKYYGGEYAGSWVYGLPELVDHKEISKSTQVSNPGCYATAIALSVAPVLSVMIAKILLLLQLLALLVQVEAQKLIL
jgi:N-acetyl-gamma-glutamyl-phosphate reductase